MGKLSVIDSLRTGQREMNALEKLRERQHEISAGLNVMELADKYICNCLGEPDSIIDEEWYAVCMELRHVKLTLKEDPENEELGAQAEKLYASVVSFLREKANEEA